MPATTARSPVYLGDYVTTDTGTGIVHSAPAYGVEDFHVVQGARHDRRRHHQPGDGRWRLRRARCRCSAGLSIWDANPKIVEALREVGHPVATRRSTSTATCTAGATRRRSSTAPPRSGSPAWTCTRLRRRPDAARNRAGRHRGHRVLPRLGQAAPATRMIANRPDWTLSRQRQWGVPMAFFVHKETGELHPRTPELLEQVAQRVEQGRHRSLAGARSAATCSATRPTIYEKNRDTLDVWFDSGTTHWTVMRGSHGDDSRSAAELRWPGRPVPGRLGPAPRLVPLVAADRLRCCTAGRPTRRC